ncbi:ATP-binding protein [Faecalibacterium prausnitzii]|uniref:ATP-binding protein n=1 Tax=Faecalibacterium prausnitzii TaxID=853 RepID=A0A3E2W6S3_9FIRM|nr:type IV secretion system DNA-binding domain-containing protein [Faecalibacterium prausnitzii]RGC20361.1 ATP-binding protein [Faecalibacterium prausnitzii]
MADELEVLEKQQLSAQRSLNDLTDQLTLADHLVYKKYLTELQNYGMVELSQQMLKVQDPAQYIRLFQLQKLTLKKGEDMFQKLSTVYYSSMAQGCSLAVMIDVPEGNAGANIYLGVREDPLKQSMKSRKLEISSKALQKVLLSNFPGSDIKGIPQKEGEKLLDEAFGEEQEAVASVSCVAALRDKSKTEDKAFVQGIERFMDAMQGEKYTALFLAEPVSNETQAAIRSGYENLYSTLSPFRKSTWSYAENQSTAVMESLCSGTSHTISDTVSTTTTDGTNQSSSVTDGTQKTKGSSGGINGGVGSSFGTSVTKISPVAGGIAGILGLGGLAASALIPGAGAVIGPLLGTAGRAVGGMASARTAFNSIARNIGGSLGVNASRGTSHSTTEQTGTSHSTSDGTSHGISDSTSQQESYGTTDTRGTGRTQQVELCNKSVEELLERIENQLKRVKESEDYGCYNCAAYFLSSTQSTALLAANTYRALMVGEGSSVESGAVNVWKNNEAEVAQLREYLKRFMQPVFARPLWENAPDSLLYTPATLVSGRELPMHLGLPTRSVHGLPIIEHAEFGRNVPDEAMPDEDKMNLGKIYHMGKEEAAGLLLNRQAMASHTFITGSTGTGKSNAVYHLLDEITKNGQTTFLVVEPAKGEYKNVFGNCTDVQVFGTNPRETPLLRMNPFAFPENIHILEHIDRLVEIFNACWPMYAAMPAVLKDAIERSYQKVGWDLRNSESEKGVFPTFFDLLDILPGVIEESHYSKDTQSDYVGALCTRVKSLTNGIYGSVLCAEDALTDEALFDRNVIVDLSRVGSMETKSLLMGILVMKLQEYRMCSSGMNSRLRHVTVLEEAHNLLRKTSAEQSQEGANLQGKSVEMLANAIAEMRTYGEGFIIADQAPGLLDMSVIRNTNTKIILRLPDEEDRKLVGKSAALKEAQIDELSKLPLGVAAVYQNEWPEAVLCKIEAYPMPENAVYHKPSKMPHEINAEFVFGQLAVGKELEPLSSSEMEQLKLWLKRHETVLKQEDSRYLERVFAGGELDVAKTRKAVFDFFGGIGTVVDYCAAAKKSLTPRKEFLEQLQGQYGLKAAAADWVLNSVISMGMSLNPDAKAVDNLRTNFEQQGGRVL